MARERGNQQHTGYGRLCVANAMEANKVTEGLFKRRLFFYCHLFAVDGGVRQIPLGFLVVFAQAMHQFVGGGYLSRNRRISKGAVRVREQLGACVGKRRQGRQKRPLKLVQVIQHESSLLKLMFLISRAQGVSKYAQSYKLITKDRKSTRLNSSH